MTTRARAAEFTGCKKEEERKTPDKVNLKGKLGDFFLPQSFYRPKSKTSFKAIFIEKPQSGLFWADKNFEQIKKKLPTFPFKLT